MRPPSSALSPLDPPTHRASASKAAPRSPSTAAHSPQRAHTSSLVLSESAPRPARCYCERAVTLLIELVRRCEGLNALILSWHVGVRSAFVALWRCARTPYWLLPSPAGEDDACKQRLRDVFRVAMANDPVFARAVDADDALDEVAEYDAFRDGFLVLPTLQSILATGRLTCIFAADAWF
ncbi:hypothetical protein BJV77DRAFT_1066605 [Russula vinacea]|nr:hypothetical protein BJV77DRAFT_1066605 [Russula vinacea]